MYPYIHVPRLQTLVYCTRTFKFCQADIYALICRFLCIIFIIVYNYIPLMSLCFYFYTISLFFYKYKKSCNLSDNSKSLQLLFYLYTDFYILYKSLSLHSLCNLKETCNVCTSNIVTSYAIFLSSIIKVVEDINHDVLKLAVNFIK